MLDKIKDYFSINLADYENINFSLEINKVILGSFIALTVGVIILNVQRGNMRLVIMQLTRHGATDKESAKTLTELGLNNSRTVKKLLSGKNALTSTVARVGETEYDYDTYVAMSKEEKKAAEHIDFTKAAFYIRPEKSDRAAFIRERYETSVLRVALFSVMLAIICGCVIVCMPGILETVNDLLNTKM